MSILPTSEQILMIDTVRDFFADQLPVSRFRFSPGRVVAPPPWPAMAELGLFAMAMPEGMGGMGLGAMDEILVLRECGRSVAPPAIFASIIAAHIMDQQAAGEIMRGTRRTALAVEDGDEVLVLDREGADFILLGGGADLRVFPAAALVSPRRVDGLDDSTTLTRGSLSGDAIARGNADGRAALLLAAMMVGLAEAARDLAVDYAKIRHQFGKPIGAFQAVKHRCTDMAMRAELGWAQVLQAARSFDLRSPDTAMQIASARLVAARAAHCNGAAAIQIHGGIGYQAECDAHIFMKRAHVYDRAVGDMGEARAAILAKIA